MNAATATALPKPRQRFPALCGKLRNRSALTESEHLASVLREQASALNDAIDQVIGSRSEAEFGIEDFIKALQTIRGVRLALETEAQKLGAP